MSAPIEAASLYVSIGERGTETTIRNMQRVGQFVDQYGKKEVSATVSANIAQADANLAKINAEVAAFKQLHPETKLLFDSNPAVRAIGVVEGKLRELKAQVAQKLSINIGALGRTGANFGANALMSGGFNLQSAGATMLQGMAQGGGLSGGVAALGGPVGIGATAIAAIGGLSLAKAGEMEKFETQLSVLLGSVDKAKARIADLTDFAAKTPFELPEVVNASKTLQVFTGDALSAGKGLQLVGDVASGTGSDFSETAMWFGRMYDAMKSGRPFGEATMRLQEMGAISGQSREKIENLAAGVKKGTITMDEAWKQASGEFSRFAGMMDKQSGTLEGKMSNLQDAIGQDFAKIGQYLLPVAKIVLDVLVGAFGILGTVIGAIGPIVDTITKPLQFLTGVLGNIYGVIAGLLSGPVDLLLKGLGAIGDAAKGAGDFLGQAFDSAATRASKAAVEFAKTPDAIAADLRESRKIIGQSAGAAADTIPREFGEAGKSAVMKVQITMHDVASAIKAGRQGIVDAMQETIDDTYDPLILAGHIAATKAELNSKDLKDALASKDKDIHNDAVLRQLQLKKDLASMLAEQTKYGTDAQRIALLKAQATSKAMVDGLKSGDKARQAASKAAAQDLATGIVALENHATGYGAKTGNSYIDGLIKVLEDRKQEVYYAHRKIANIFQASSPPGPESPMHEIDKWGWKTGEAWIENFAGAIGTGPSLIRGSLGRVAGSLVMGGARGPAQEGLAIGRGGGGGVAHFHFNITPQPGAMTPAFAQAFVEQVGPHMAPWLRKAGYIPATAGNR